MKKLQFLLIVLVAFVAGLFLVNFLSGLLFGLAALFIPKYLEIKKRKAYLENFNLQLIDGIDLISNSLRAGLTFQQAVSVLVSESTPPLSPEFKEVLDKHRLGVTIENALIELSDKHKSDNLDLLVTSVIITKETGGNLAEVLDKVSGSMREKNRLEGQVKVLTAQGKLSGWIVGLLPFMLAGIIFLIDRDMIMPMFTTFAGIAMVILAVLMELIGILFIRKIVNIDV